MTPRLAVCLLGGALALTLGCAPLESVRNAERFEAAQGQLAGAGPRTSSEAQLSSLDVPGFLPAVFFVPTGDEPRPLVAAAHGAGGSPEWECEYWRRLTRERAFIVCLRGTAMGGESFYYKNHYALRDELAAAVKAARAASSRIAPRGGIYAGFSQGASMGSLVVATQAEQLPYVVLIEGFEQWNIPLGRTFAKKGGKGVLFACGTAQCASKATKSESALRRTPVRARATHAAGAGHTPVGAVQELVADNLAWLVDGDPLWQ